MFRFTTRAATLSIVGLASASAGASSAPVATPSSCLLDAATVAEVSGTEIVEVSQSGGAVASTSAGDFSLLAAPDLSWTGCGYETSDASELDVSELVTIEGGAHRGRTVRPGGRGRDGERRHRREHRPRRRRGVPLR